MSENYEFNTKLARPTTASGITELSGFSSLIGRYRDLLQHENADYFAVLSDWVTIGLDIRAAYDALMRPPEDRA